MRKKEVIIENHLSKTKTRAAIAVTNDLIYYGDDTAGKQGKIKVYSDFNIDFLNNVSDPSYVATYRLKVFKFSPADLFAMFLKYLVKISKDYLKSPITKVIFVVPQAYSVKQLLSLQRIAFSLGITKVGYTDSNRSALSYFQYKGEDKPLAGIVDIGYSYTQVSAYRLGAKMEIFTRDYVKIAGQDFDNNLASIVKQKLKSEKTVNMDYISSLKEKLSANKNVIAKFGEEEVEITRKEFEEAISISVVKIVSLLKKTLPAEVQFIQMIGGSTRIPLVKDQISKEFEGKLRFNLNGDDSAALGAVKTDKSLEINQQFYKLRKTQVFLEIEGNRTEVNSQEISVKAGEEAKIQVKHKEELVQESTFKTPCETKKLKVLLKDDLSPLVSAECEGKKTKIELNSTFNFASMTDSAVLTKISTLEKEFEVLVNTKNSFEQFLYDSKSAFSEEEDVSK